MLQKNHVPKKGKKKHHVPWENKVIKSKQEAVRRAHRAMSQKKTELSTFYFEKTKKIT